MKICWLSSGEDREALSLLGTVYEATKDGTIDGEIAVLFLDRERGASAASDAMIAYAEERGIPVELAGPGPLSSGSGMGPGERREIFDRRLKEGMERYSFDVVFLAGYRVPFPAALVQSRIVLALKPSLPGAREGEFEAVVREAVEKEVRAFGVMIHMAGASPAESAPVTFVNLVLEGGQMEDLYCNAYRGDSTSKDALRRLMEQCERAAEGPLTVRTFSLLSRGEISIRGGKVYRDGRCREEGADITSEVLKC